MNAIDTMSNKINLAKGIVEYPGKGVYPEDLSKEEFHSILTKMLNEGKIEEVKNILTQRSVVEDLVMNWSGLITSINLKKIFQKWLMK